MLGGDLVPNGTGLAGDDVVHAVGAERGGGQAGPSSDPDIADRGFRGGLAEAVAIVPR